MEPNVKKDALRLAVKAVTMLGLTPMEVAAFAEVEEEFEGLRKDFVEAETPIDPEDEVTEDTLYDSVICFDRDCTGPIGQDFVTTMGDLIKELGLGADFVKAVKGEPK